MKKKIYLESAGPQIPDFSVAALNSGYTFPQLAYHLAKDLGFVWKYAQIQNNDIDNLYSDPEYYALKKEAFSDYETQVWLVSNNTEKRGLIKANPFPRYLLVLYGEDREQWWAYYKPQIKKQTYCSWIIEVPEDKFGKSKWLQELMPAEVIEEEIEKCIKETLTRQKSLLQ